MFNKFKNGENVFVIGVGKNEDKFYYKRKGKIICRDPYFKDYNIRFEDGTEDWFDEIYIKKIRRKKNGNKRN